jgi:hypothetical protein
MPQSKNAQEQVQRQSFPSGKWFRPKVTFFLLGNCDSERYGLKRGETEQ